MNIQNNELHDLNHEDLEPLFGKYNPDISKDLKPVPPYLNRAAKSVLKGRPKANVSFKSGGKLSKWAAQQRRGNK